MTNFDGKRLLKETLERAGHGSLEHAVAGMTLFSHPKTVQQTGNRNVFRVIRDFPNRGKIIEYQKGGRVMACDNQSPTNAFLWAAPDLKGDDIQFNHVYKDSKNVEIYTSLANICVTPAFLAKLTDKDEKIKALLRYRAYELYGFVPDGAGVPVKPEACDDLEWMKPPDPVENLEAVYRKRIKECPDCRASRSAREIGWLFSDFRPDLTV